MTISVQYTIDELISHDRKAYSVFSLGITLRPKRKRLSSISNPKYVNKKCNYCKTQISVSGGGIRLSLEKVPSSEGVEVLTARTLSPPRGREDEGVLPLTDVPDNSNGLPINPKKGQYSSCTLSDGCCGWFTVCCLALILR